MSSPDKQLRELERLKALYPGNKEVWDRWFRQRERMGLPLFAVQVYVEFWPTANELDPQSDPYEATLFCRNATFNEVVELGVELGVDTENIISDYAWLTSWHSPQSLYTHPFIEDADALMSYMHEHYDVNGLAELDAVAYALYVTYLDGGKLSDKDIERISEGIEDY